MRGCVGPAGSVGLILATWPTLLPSRRSYQSPAWPALGLPSSLPWHSSSMPAANTTYLTIPPGPPLPIAARILQDGSISEDNSEYCSPTAAWL